MINLLFFNLLHKYVQKDYTEKYLLVARFFGTKIANIDLMEMVASDILHQLYLSATLSYRHQIHSQRVSDLQPEKKKENKR